MSYELWDPYFADQLPKGIVSNKVYQDLSGKAVTHINILPRLPLIHNFKILDGKLNFLI